MRMSVTAARSVTNFEVDRLIGGGSRRPGRSIPSLHRRTLHKTAFPPERVVEIHLAGHSADPALGDRLLIDSHDAPVSPAVWSLYERLIGRIGPRPTLIERDDNLPAFERLLAERERAEHILRPALERAA